MSDQWAWMAGFHLPAVWKEEEEEVAASLEEVEVEEEEEEEVVVVVVPLQLAWLDWRKRRHL